MTYIHPKDRTLEHSATSGAGPYTLSGAVDLSFKAFSASMSVGDTTIGTIVEPGVAFWSGVLTYSAANQVTATGTAFDSKGTFGAGTKEIFMGGPASRTPLRDSNNAFDGLQVFNNTTEATGLGTVASALFAGGVEIAKKLFVVGAVSLASTLAVGGTASAAYFNSSGGVQIATNYGLGFGTSVNATGTPQLTLDGTTFQFSNYGSLAVLKVNPTTGVVNVSGNLYAQTNIYIGSGGTGGTTAITQIIGGSAANAGARVDFAKNAIGTNTWFLGHRSAIFAGGSTSNDFVLNSYGIGGDAVSFNATTLAASFSGNVSALGITTSGDIHAGGQLQSDGNIIRFGSAGSQYIWFNGGRYTFSADPMSISSTTLSISPTTGALTIAGGLGVSGAINVGGKSKIAYIYVDGALLYNTDTVTGSYASTVLKTGSDYANALCLSGIGTVFEVSLSKSGGGTLALFLQNATGVGSITSNGTSCAYNTTSDERGKPNRERLSLDYARLIIDTLEIWDFDKKGNAIRGIGVLAQQAYGVHKSFATPGQTPDAWWQAEKAGPVPFLVANVQQNNSRIDTLEAELAELKSRFAA